MSNDVMMTDPTAVEQFMFGGNATMTIVSRKSRVRYTYRIRAPHIDTSDSGRPVRVNTRKVWFVAVLDGSDYDYIGQIFENATSFRTGAKSKIPADDPSVKAFAWFAEALLARKTIPEALEIYHAGRCCRCGRELTTPEFALGYRFDIVLRGYEGTPFETPVGTRESR